MAAAAAAGTRTDGRADPESPEAVRRNNGTAVPETKVGVQAREAAGLERAGVEAERMNGAGERTVVGGGRASGAEGKGVDVAASKLASEVTSLDTAGRSLGVRAMAAAAGVNANIRQSGSGMAGTGAAEAAAASRGERNPADHLSVDPAVTGSAQSGGRRRILCVAEWIADDRHGLANPDVPCPS